MNNLSVLVSKLDVDCNLRMPQLLNLIVRKMVITAHIIGAPKVVTILEISYVKQLRLIVLDDPHVIS